MLCTEKRQIKNVIFNPGNHFERLVGYSAQRLVLMSKQASVRKEQVRNLTKESQKRVLTGKKMFLMCTGRVTDISFLYTPECTSVCH